MLGDPGQHLECVIPDLAKELNHGVQQYPLSGVSMVCTFDAESDAPTKKEVQYYAMLGTRGIWKDDWKTAAVHRHQAGAVFKSNALLEPGKYTLGMEFEKTVTGDNGESLGRTKLYIDDQVVDSGEMRTQPAKFTLSGDGLCIGYDSGDAVSSLYETPGEFKGGTIHGVGVSVKGEPYLNLEAEAKRMLMQH